MQKLQLIKQQIYLTILRLLNFLIVKNQNDKISIIIVIHTTPHFAVMSLTVKNENQYKLRSRNIMICTHGMGQIIIVIDILPDPTHHSRSSRSLVLP